MVVVVWEYGDVFVGCFTSSWLASGCWLGWLAVSTTTLPDIDRAQASGSDWRMVPPPPPLNFVVLVLVEMHD
jgi:hypothetical protein